jgi:tetratricopeptide (TPR) repeat protein
VLASLSIGLATTLLALGEARAQEQLARREASRSGAFVKLFVEDVIGAAHPTESEGQDMRVSELVAQAESLLDSVDDPTVRADVELQIGRILMGLGKYERAYEHLAAVVVLREKDPVATPYERATSLFGLAAACRSLERDGWGLEYAERALAIYREAYGTPSIHAAAALRDVAQIRERRGERADARKLMLEALAEAAASEEPGSESEVQARILMDAAVLLYASEGDYFESTKMYREAIDILTRLSVPALTRANALASYARLMSRAGNAPDAVTAINEAVAIARRAYAPDNPHLAFYLSSHATVCLHLKRLPEAEAFQREAIAICERAFGPDSEQVAHYSLPLAGVLEAQDRQQEAIPLCARSREVFLTKFGPDDQRTLNAQSLLGDLHRMVGSYTEAERLLLDAEARLKRTNASPVVYALTRNRLAILYSAMGNKAEAAKWLSGG